MHYINEPLRIIAIILNMIFMANPDAHLGPTPTLDDVDDGLLYSSVSNKSKIQLIKINFHVLRFTVL